MRRVASEDYLSGQTCENALMETKKCSMEPCPSRDCKLSHWSEWSPCTRDSLQKTRRRDVLISPEGQGMGCNVSLVEAGFVFWAAGEDCVISEWSDWSSCDKSCHGGQSYRHRRIMHYNTHGGSCDISSLQEVTSCNTEPCNGATKNCEMLNWEPWSVCSQQTGTGLASRKRQLAGATGDGKACNGTTVELKSCMIAAAEVVDCAWGGWVEWSSCTRTCGGGSKRRSRAVEQAPRNGGKACEAKNKEEVTACHDEPCSGECLNGKWGDWTAWGACSAQCGNAFKVRRRAVAVLPNACGAMPEGPREEFSLCSGLPLCEQDSDCRLSLWTEWSLCSRECRGVRERLRTIVAFARGNGTPCSEESLKEISDCNPILGEAAPPACGEADAQDCLLQDWSLWSGCSRTCGSGEQLRKRIVLQPSSNGGRPCEGNLTVVRGCNAQPCHVEEVKDCKWAAWSDWGDCTHCGGQRTRHRVIQQLPTAGGKLCEEKDAKEISNCTSHCGSRRFCVWSEWTGTGCATCGGTSMRSRALNLVEADADAFFIGSEDSSCFGSQLNVSSCPKEDCTRECVRVDCEFGDWSDWNEPTCVGLCERQRVVTQVNSECGTPCSGALLETRVCTPTCDQPVDCELSDWADWSACSNSTGYLRGQRYRRRHITQPPVHGGLACYGDLEQTKACKGSLPDPCEFSAWKSWSICSTTCGEGFQSRGRSIEQAEPGGMQCSGMLEEVRDCHAGLWQDCGLGHSQDCIFDMWSEWTACGFTMQRQRERVFKQPALLGGLPCMGPMHEVETCHRPPVDCVVSDWTEWDECDRSCGAGQARRQRQVVTFPEHGGQLCPSDLTQMKACSLPNCNIQDCQVSGWLDWGDCSTSCGDGIQSRLRSVLNLREPGGFGCFFSVAENRDCHHPACTVDCAWEDWNDWSACSQSCGGGLKMRSRGIHSMPEGGKSCDEKDMQEVLPCNLGSCNEHCVDGLWDEWESWSPCSASCGGGVAFRRREVKLMANSCGNPAVGDDKETRFCNVGVHCNGDKDCLYTGWSSWNDCSATCNGITVRRRSIATYGHGNGLFCQGALEEVGPCNPAEGYAPPEHCVEGPAVDCKLSEWTPWTGCSASCDGGEQRRHRHVLQHPRHGGEPCKGSLDEIQECARDHCGGGHPVDCVYGDWKEWAECHKCSGERKRIRHILVYPAEGGRECAPADLEEVGVCPNPCAEELFCSWQSWSDWGSCSMSCGPGGKRSRTRQLEKVMKPLNFANAQTDAKSAHSGPEHRKLIEKYHALFARTRSLEEGQTKEILLAFSAGFLALLALAGLARRVRFEYAAVSQEAQASDTEAPLVASL
ncbi:unnamed protein product [Effrenium voratum]|nr:unnamed protein product [Effrenium voratum]